ncbi:epoxide hydrolase protein [Rutstroemia sp. NJR-2017a BVV2]|nr:epoxide hydrolase protein [Rutstroemia sp. NJR-2017a BVV2]
MEHGDQVAQEQRVPEVEVEVQEDVQVKKYNIHVSTKYLDLTRKKLELTRLPHDRPGVGEGEEEEEKEVVVGNGGGNANADAEGSEGASGDGVLTKKEVESLVDYWLEEYTWRERETWYNATYPQYRSTFKVSAFPSAKTKSKTPTPAAQTLRIHFLHLRSSRKDAIPLLLVPSFPSSNLTVDIDVLTKELCNPAQEDVQAFDVVIPSIPGTGFSDEISGIVDKGDVMRETAGIFDRLMKRLGYTDYVASMMGSGKEKGGEVDYYLGREIGGLSGGGCRGMHLIEPRWGVPTVDGGVWEWVRWKAALFFHAKVWGYEEGDWKNLNKQGGKGQGKMSLLKRKGSKKKLRYGAMAAVSLREPDTLAYALCDSPVGLLSFVATALKKKSPRHQLSKEKMIDLCQLWWLPGPEAALRYYANALQESDQLQGEKGKQDRGRVAITVFDGEGEPAGYSPPAWGMKKHEVVFVQRATGKPGLLAWERPAVIFDGIRGLTKEVLKVDERIKVRKLDEVVVGSENRVDGAHEDYGMQLDVESPDTIVAR